MRLQDREDNIGFFHRKGESYGTNHLAWNPGSASYNRRTYHSTYHHLVRRRCVGCRCCRRLWCRDCSTVSLVLLFFTRPVALKLMNKDTEKTNVNSFPGKTAVVIQKIDNLAQTGQVRINDIEWLARTPDDNVTIPEGTVVVIKEVHGVRLIVEKK